MKPITDAQIKKWKQQHGEHNVYQVDVTTEDNEVLFGFFKKPDLDVLAAAEAHAASDHIKKAVFYFDNCWLGGDPRIQEEGDLKLGAANQVVRLFRVPVVTIKKL